MASLKAIQRYLIIIRETSQSNGITLKELQEKVIDELTAHGDTNIAVSDRTLKRDLQNIRDNLKIGINYTPSKGYHMAEDEVSQPKNIENILESFDILNALNADTGMNHFVYPARRPAQGREHLYPLLKATQKKHLLFIRYQKFGEQEISEWEIEPYALKEWRSRWYLLGIIKGKNQLTTFGLDRIISMKKLAGKFIPRDINISEIYRDCFGIYNDENIPAEEVILSFNKKEGEYVKSQPIHHSQEILLDPTHQDRLVIRLKIKITKEFILELLARGFSLQVHKPDSLRQEILTRHQEAIDINSHNLQRNTEVAELDNGCPHSS